MPAATLTAVVGIRIMSLRLKRMGQRRVRRPERDANDKTKSEASFYFLYMYLTASRAFEQTQEAFRLRRSRRARTHSKARTLRQTGNYPNAAIRCDVDDVACRAVGCQQHDAAVRQQIEALAKAYELAPDAVTDVEVTRLAPG